MIGGTDSILVKIGSLSKSEKNYRENPYYLALRLSANISKHSSAHNFLNIHLIFCLRGDMYSKIEWSNLGENGIIS